MTRNQALKQALKNAAGLIDNMDLDQFYGHDCEDNEDLMTEAQQYVVAMLNQKAATIKA